MTRVEVLDEAVAEPEEVDAHVAADGKLVTPSPAQSESANWMVAVEMASDQLQSSSKEQLVKTLAHLLGPLRRML